MLSLPANTLSPVKTKATRKLGYYASTTFNNIQKRWRLFLWPLLFILIPVFWLWFIRDSLSLSITDFPKITSSNNILNKENSAPMSANDGNKVSILADSNVAMDDPKLVNAVRKLFIPPSNLSYKFDDNWNYLKPNANPSAGQTQAVADILKGFGPNGFFIECGANDGEWHSNTVWPELTLKWQGLLIEADPNTFPKLLRRNRKAWTGHFCLSDLTYPKKLTFFSEPVSGVMSGLIKFKHLEKRLTPVDIQCIPLYTVLLAINRTTVDYFSLDVEGSELGVLKTIPFDKVIFKVITIEHILIKEGKLALREFMKSKGYIFYQTVIGAYGTAGDSIFIHNSVQLTEEQKQSIGKGNGGE